MAGNIHFFMLQKSFEFSNAVDLNGLENISDFEKDVATNRFALDSEMAWVELLKVLTRFSEVKLNDYFSGNADRGAQIEHYLQAGKSVLSAGTRQRDFLLALETNLSGDVSQYEDAVKAPEEVFKSSLDKFDAFGVDHALNDLKESNYKLISARIDLMRIKALEKKYTPVLEQIAKTIKAVDDNKEAIKYGIKVKYPSGVSAGVIEVEK